MNLKPRPRFMPKTDACAYLFRKSRTVTEEGLLPDMDIVLAMYDKDMRVQDLLDALEDLAPHTFSWYTVLKATRDCPELFDSSQ